MRSIGVIAALLAAGCAAGRAKPGQDGDPVDRALAAMGGADAVAALDALVIRGTAKHWEPEQSLKAGGETRFVGDSTFVASRALGRGEARIEWVRRLVYSFQREYRFTEVVTPEAGLVDGVDSSVRTRQSLGSSPPRHAMSGLRLAAARRELLRTSPRLVADMKARPESVERAGDVDGMPAVTYRAGGAELVVIFDRASGLPARIRTRDADNIHGESSYDAVLSDWRTVGGAKVAHRIAYELNGMPIALLQYDEVRLEAALAPATFEIPGDVRAGAPKPATGDVPYQWVLRRQHIGAYLDSDRVGWDPAASDGLRLVEVAPGVQLVQGGSHNSLVVELADSLAVVDAPIDDRQSRWTLDAARAKYPAKPVKHLVLTHHHMDHAGGTRAFVAEGAEVIVGAGNGPHFAKVLGPGARVREVGDRMALPGGRLEVLRIENPHADGMVVGWIPEAGLAFVSDLWNPGREKLGEKATAGQAALVAAMRQRGVRPARFAGGHGSVAEYAPLEALVEGAR